MIISVDPKAIYSTKHHKFSLICEYSKVNNE